MSCTFFESTQKQACHDKLPLNRSTRSSPINLAIMSQKSSPDRSLKRGKLRIGNDWNAITIIALSQSNPLKAVAELVENSIDARATNVSITRGRSEGKNYLEIRDNGQGIPRDSEGRPD